MEIVVHVNNGMLLSLNTHTHTQQYAFESVLTRWMNLEPIVQSEVSQKEKDKFCILTHIYGI